MRATKVRRVSRRFLRSLSARLEGRAARKELEGSRPSRYDRLARRVHLVGKRLVPAVKEPAWGDGIPVDEALVAARAENMLDVRLPLVLVGQVGRSGGTLLLRLFDGQPSCLVVPHELGSMLPGRPLSLDPEDDFARLTPNILVLWHRNGARIGKQSLSGEASRRQPFDLPPELLRRLFVEAVHRSPPATDRDVIDRYLTAYFAAWSAGPTPEGRRWVVGFEPSAIEKIGRMERFDANYPDGRVIATIRDPWSWMVSASAWSWRFAQPDVAMRKWLRSTRAALARKAERPEQTLLLSFDDLILDTEKAMRRVSDFLGIPFHDSLVNPSLNGADADSNSSFPGVNGQVSSAPVLERRKLLAQHEERWIERHARDVWEEARAVLASP